MVLFVGSSASSNSGFQHLAVFPGGFGLEFPRTLPAVEDDALGGALSLPMTSRIYSSVAGYQGTTVSKENMSYTILLI